MIYLTIGLAVAALVLLARFWGFKRELRRMTLQLAEYNRSETEKKLDLQLMDRELEQLAKEINRGIDLTKQARAEQRRTQGELKAAIANMSHDLRTPMTSILGYLQLLESQDTSPEQRNQYLTSVRSSASRLKVLLEDFFELSRIEAADDTLQLERIKMNQLTIEVLTGFYEQFRQQGREPVLELPEEEGIVLADRSAVKRVIENLVLNALNHSDGHVWVRLEASPASVQLTVRNTVTDIEERELQFLFDRFYKADPTRSGRGSGLGLSIVKSLMTKMQGSVQAELQDQELSIRCEWKTMNW